MKTLQFTPTNKNTRANARKLATFLKSQGIAAVAPSKKDQSGNWTVKASIKRSKAFYAVNKGVALKTKRQEIAPRLKMVVSGVLIN